MRERREGQGAAGAFSDPVQEENTTDQNKGPFRAGAWAGAEPLPKAIWRGPVVIPDLESERSSCGTVEILAP